MKKSNMMLLTGLSAATLAGLICLQIQWMQNAARLEQAQWSHRVHMAMWWVKDQLAQHVPPGAATSGPARMALQGKTDSLLRVAFRHYDVQFGYDYAPIRPVAATDPALGQIVGFGYCPLTAFLAQRGVGLTVRAQDRLAFWGQMKLLVAASALLTTLTIACLLATLSSLRKLKKRWAMTTDFVNNMTHEFKTPVTAIALATRMLRKEAVVREPGKVQWYADAIGEQNRRLGHHVERILRAAQWEKGTVTLDKQAVDVHELLEKTLQTPGLGGGEGATLCRQWRATATRLQADALHLSNVFANLIENALKYSGPASPVQIATYNTHDALCIAIADEGIGIHRAQQKYIFRSFYRVPTRNVHNVKGFGLGLSYAKMVVEAHRGTIHVKSEPGKGSCFTVCLPLKGNHGDTEGTELHGEKE
jgi:two-component system phosphate regulon sensor histidine kinase PhoR